MSIKPQFKPCYYRLLPLQEISFKRWTLSFRSVGAMSSDKLAIIRSKLSKVQDKFDRALQKWYEISDCASDARRRYEEAKSCQRSFSAFFCKIEVRTLKSSKNYYYWYLKRQAKLLSKLGKDAHRIEAVERKGFSHLLSEESSNSGSSMYSIPGMFDDIPTDSGSSGQEPSGAGDSDNCHSTLPFRSSE